MSQVFSFSVPDDRIDQVKEVINACNKFDIEFSKLVVEGILNQFHTGKWSKLFNE